MSYINKLTHFPLPITTHKKGGEILDKIVDNGRQYLFNYESSGSDGHHESCVYVNVNLTTIRLLLMYIHADVKVWPPLISWRDFDTA